MKKPKQQKSSRKLVYKLFPLIGILLLAIFFRFYKLGDLLHWTLDEEYWAYVSYNLSTGYHIPLIGGPVSGTGMQLGPLYVWLMALPFAIFHGDPIGVGALMSLLGVVTTGLLYLVTTKIWDRKVGFIASLMWACSFLVTIYDRKFWNASPIPLLSLMAFFCVYQISKGKLRWTYLLAVTLAIAFHAHMTSAALFLFVFVSWLLLKIPLRKKQALLSITVFLLLQTPLALFELRHEYFNTNAIISFVSQKKQRTSIMQSVQDVGSLALNTSSRLIYVHPNRDIADELTLCRDYAQKRTIPSAVFSIPILISIASMIKRRSGTGEKLVLILVLTNLLGLLWFRINANQQSWYTGQLNEYYLLPSFPAYFMIIALTFRDVSRRSAILKWIIIGGLLLYALSNTQTLLSARHSGGFQKKKEIINKVLLDVHNRPFTFTVKSKDKCRLYGYRYLLTVRNQEPVNSYLDGQFGWLYEKRLSAVKPELQVTVQYEDGKMSYVIEPSEQ